jgi:hypothetical protein
LEKEEGKDPHDADVSLFCDILHAPLTLFKGVDGYEEVECEVREVAWV